jgi:redox-sensitive bicupin YhaK (pirin superfamily)
MGKTIHHPADSRGATNIGWLDSRHTFSFGGYQDPDRMNFGALRVLNDDVVSGGMGFGEHPHRNMEIVSIPLEGDLQHRDSMGNVAVIREGDIQVMSAGTGVYHSEFNRNVDKPVKFLQIWILPNRMNVQPRYQQLTLEPASRRNRLQRVLAPEPEDGIVWIHQDAWFHMGNFDQGMSGTYDLKRTGNGVYAFVVKGSFEVEGTRLGERDGLGITETGNLAFQSLSEKAEILLMEVPTEGFPA